MTALGVVALLPGQQETPRRWLRRYPRKCSEVASCKKVSVHRAIAGQRVLSRQPEQTLGGWQDHSAARTVNLVYELCRFLAVPSLSFLIR